jgi:hypothetical protein
MPDWFRPDRSKCIVIAPETWNGWPVYLIVPVGKQIEPDALAWMKNYAKSNSSLLVYLDPEGNVVSFAPSHIRSKFEDFLRNKKDDWWIM